MKLYSFVLMLLQLSYIRCCSFSIRIHYSHAINVQERFFTATAPALVRNRRNLFRSIRSLRVENRALCLRTIRQVTRRRINRNSVSFLRATVDLRNPSLAKKNPRP